MFLQQQKGALRELLSSFIHYLYKPLYRFLMPFRFRLHCESFILLCGANVVVWCYALCSQNANHRGANCSHSLTDEQARRLASFDYLHARNFMSEYFDTRYLFSLSVTNSLPFAICHLIVLSEQPMISDIRLTDKMSGYIARLFSSIRSNLFLPFRLRYASTLVSAL